MPILQKVKNKIYIFLKKSEKWTKTDMIYLSKGGFWLSVNYFVIALSSALLSLAFANLLSPEVYGNYRYILSIISILSIPTLGGMSDALIRSVARGYEGSVMPVLKTKIKWGLLGGVASIILAIYYYLNDNTILTISFLIAGIFIPFMDPISLYGDLLYGKKLFKISTKLSLFNKLFTTIIIIAAIFFSNNILIILAAYLVSNTFIRLICLLITLHKIKTNNKVDTGTMSYGKHLSLIGVLSVVSGNIDKILLFHYVGAVELAIYGFATTVPYQIRAFLKLLMPLSMPKLAVRNIEDIKKSLPAKMAKLSLIIIIIIIIYVISAPYIYKLFFPRYTDSIFYSQLIALSLVFFPRNIMQQTLVAKAQKKKLYALSTSNQIIKITLLFFLIQAFGILGIIITDIITYLYATIFSFYLFKKIPSKTS